MRWVESKSEKKWLKTASLFTTCSENWVQNIGNFINRPGRVVLNGYEDNLLSAAKTKRESDTFIIAHNGTIFSTQIVEVFLEGFKKFIDETPDAKIKLLFPGVENSIEALRIHSNSLGYEKYISTSSRIPKSELIDILSSAHMFLMVGTQGVKGHHSSKIFEYLALQKPIMLTPDDNDVMAELILKTKAGFIAKDSEEVKKFLIKIYSDFVAGKPIDYSPDMEEISFYSREKQAEILSGILNEVALMP
jgi:glycosyltransferase involved in cell wall biosynthesis